MKRLLIVPLLMLSVSGVANAEPGDGNELLVSCQDSIKVMDNSKANFSHYNAGYCFGLVHGALAVTSSTSENALLKSCTPNAVTVGQATRIVTRYLQNHPEQLHLPDTVLVYKSFQDAYPCKS